MKNQCLHCSKPTNNPKFCSKSCSAKETNKIPKRKLIRTCTNCTNIVRNYKSTLCETHFQQRSIEYKEYLQNLTIADYFDRDCIKRLHPSSKFAHIRGLCRVAHKNLLLKPCHNCGYNKHVELCHIKALSSFPPTAKINEVNASENIIQLCPNCHWEFDKGLITL